MSLYWLVEQISHVFRKMSTFYDGEFWQKSLTAKNLKYIIVAQSF